MISLGRGNRKDFVCGLGESGAWEQGARNGVEEESTGEMTGIGGHL